MTLSKIKEQFRGTGQVFRFTFLQLIKSRSTIITMLFTLIFAMGALPVMTLIGGGSAVKQRVEVYVDNRIGLELPGLETRLKEALAPTDVSLRAGPLPADAADAVGLTLDENDESVGLSVTWNSTDSGVM
ncbi:MAG: hypothetical protein II680_06300, partial [Clostridia bacterium]|nr:hypothetical protein [Clostridia bacterium]